jgi:hypothetical protein
MIGFIDTFFTITVGCNISHFELLPNAVMRNLSRISNCYLLLSFSALWLLESSRVESCAKTDGQSASLSWNKAPIWDLQPDFYYCQTRVFFMWALSLKVGQVCRLQLLLDLASAVVLESESRGIRDHILLAQICAFPFGRLLRLAGLRWRYLTPPPHGIYPATWNRVNAALIEDTMSNS